MELPNLSFNIQNNITERQYQVLELIADGLTNEEIATKLCMSKRTAEGIRSDLLNRTGARNTAALVAFAFRNGILK